MRLMMTVCAVLALLPDCGQAAQRIGWADLQYDAAKQTYYYNLTHDVYGSLYVDETNILSGIEVRGNGHTVHFDPSKPGEYIGLNLWGNYNVTVMDLTISGDFTVGVFAQNASGCRFLNVDVFGADSLGYDLTNISGGAVLIQDVSVINTGNNNLHAIAAMSLRGANYTVNRSYIHGLSSRTEALGISFPSYNLGGNLVTNSTLSGVDSTGWTFGVWSDNDLGGTIINNSHLVGWDWGIGSAIYPVDVIYSTIDANYIGSLVNPSANSVLIERIAPNNQAGAVLVGNGSENHLRGGTGPQTLIGGDGNDDLQGGDGDDTFVFTVPPSPNAGIDRIIYFEKGIDKILINGSGSAVPVDLQIGAAASGTQPVLVFTSSTDFLYYDPDGAGGQPMVPIAYVPFGGDLGWSDILVNID